MNIKIWTDNEANIYSKREELVDTEDLGFSAVDWKSLTEDEKFSAIRDYWLEQGAFQYGWEDSK